MYMYVSLDITGGQLSVQVQCTIHAQLDLAGLTVSTCAVVYYQGYLLVEVN